MQDKSRIQSDQYQFPYHYLVDPETEDFGRNLDWGLDYLTYMRKVMELLKKYLDSDILDVGCGDGFLLHHLAKAGALANTRRAIGIDVDGKAIRFAQAFSHDLQEVAFIEQDIATYDEPVSLITTVETFEHIPDDVLPGFIENIDRLLLPDGVLIISVPSAVRAVIPKHFRHYDLDMLHAYFPTYELLEVHYMSARKNVLFQLIARLLANRRLNLNFGIFKRLLLGAHARYTSDVSADRGAHIVAAFRKP